MQHAYGIIYNHMIFIKTFEIHGTINCIPVYTVYFKIFLTMNNWFKLEFIIYLNLKICGILTKM